MDKLLVRRRFNYAGYNFEAEASQISLQFSDGVIKHANLGKKGLSRIKIKGADKTRSVNITITKVYQEFTHSEKSNVGFSEIEMKKDSAELDFNVFVGAETGILKGVNVNQKATISKNFHNLANLQKDFEITCMSFGESENESISFGYLFALKIK